MKLKGVFGWCYSLANVLVVGLEKKLTSAVRKEDSIRCLAEETARDDIVKRELDHLVYELGKGNLHAGLGRPGHIKGTDIFYLRGRNGGRLYYHQITDGYEILAKSGKKNQEKVIRKLLEIYE